MQFDSIRSLFANAVARSAQAHNGARARTDAGNNPPRARVLSLESLETRELLSATPLEIAGVSEIALASQETAPLDALDLSGVQMASEPASTVVTSLADKVDAGDGVVTLREAIAVYANDWDTITFAPSLKGGTITLDGSEITINKSLTIDASALWNVANDAPGLTLDANSRSQIFRIAGDNVVLIDSLAFTGGNATNGGAIYADSSDLTISNSTFQNNTAVDGYGGYGGAIYAYDSGLLIYDSTFQNNTAGSGYGGYGGAIYAYRSSLSAYNSSFHNNTASSGGAINALYTSLTISNSTLRNNVASSGGYGPYHSRGGAIYVNDATLAIYNSSVTQNEAGYGSAIWCDSQGDAFLFNATVSGNISTFRGSGSNGQGAIAFTGSALNIYNSIVAGNVNGDLGVISDWQENDNAVNAYNVLSDFSEWSNADAVAYGYDRSRPLFTNPEQGDYTLANGSQAINAGDNEYVDYYDEDEDAVDLAGGPRILNGVVDLGAFEREAAPLRVQSYDSSTRKATLQWDAIQGAASYTLKISKDGGATWTNYAQGLVGTSTTVNSIYVNKSYAFRIYSVNQQGVTSTSFSEVAFAPCALGSVNKVGDTISVTVNGATNASAETRWYYRLNDSYVEITQARGLLEYTPVPLTEYAGLQYAHEDYSVAVFAVGLNDSLGSGDEATVALTKERASTVVTSLADAGDCYDGVITLRDAVYYANAGDTITFAPSLKGGTITLGGQEIWIDKSLKIDASALWDETTNAPGITLDANSMSGILGVADYEVEWDEDSGRPIITTFVELDSLAFTRGFSDEGGAIYATNGVSLSISNSTFQDNTAEDSLGGAVVAFDSELTISNSIFQNNAAETGGAIAIYGSDFTITNSILARNTAVEGSAFFMNDSSLRDLRIQFFNVTVVDNILSASDYEGDYEPEGLGAIYCSPGSGTYQFDIYNSIVAGNQGADVILSDEYWDDYREYDWFNTYADAHNVLTSFTGWSNGNAGVVAYDPSQPLFTNAALGDYTLATGSQAIDKGDNNYVSTETDLAGNARIIGVAVDLGAYEYESATPLTPLDAPTWKSTSSTYNSVTATWNAVANASGYVVEYKSSTDASYTVMPSTTNTTITIPNLASETTYKLRVYAVGDGTNYTDSAYSAVKAVKTKAAPAVLTQLDAPVWKSSSSTSDSVTVAWNAVANASGYVVEYKSSTDASYTVMPATTNTTITIPNLASETTYKLRVYAVGDGINYSDSAYSTIKAVKTKVAPAVLTQLDAPVWKSSSSTSDSVTVAWNAVANASGYVVEYKSSTDTSYTVMPATTDTTITIANLAPETTYKLRVYAVGDGISYSDSAYSTVKAVKTKVAPAVLTQLDAPTWKSSSSTANSVTVAWNAVANATGYVVEYKSSTDASYTVMPATTDTTITIANLAPETTYKLRVYAVGDGISYSDSAYSAVKAVKTKVAPAVLTQLDAPVWKSSSSTSDSVTVAWNAVANASGYVVEYKSSTDTSYTVMPTTTNTTITIANLAPETTYKLRVYAVGDGSNYSDSAYSTVKAVKTKVAPAVLTQLDAQTWKSSSSTYNSVTVAWNAVANASGYVVEYKSSTDASYTVAPTTPSTTITIPNLAPETTYKLRVYAVGDGSNYSDSAYSTVKAVKTKVAPASAVLDAAFADFFDEEFVEL